MNATYEVSLSPSATAECTYNTVTGSAPGPSADPMMLSTDNYPADNVPLMDSSGLYKMPNTANQEIFKNLPLSWWISCINAKTVQYRPVSNTVNWAYVTPDGKDIHILYDISEVLIPNTTETYETDNATARITLKLKDNNCLCMTQSMHMPWMKRPPHTDSV